MKKTLLFLAVAAVLAACAKEPVKPGQTPGNTDITEPTDTVELLSGNIEFSGTLEAPVSTRTEPGDRTDNGDGTYTTKVLWKADDEISILWGTGVGDKTTATAASAGETTSFSATVGAASDFYAVYPSSLNPTYNGAGGLLFTIPGIQDGSFASANIAVAKNDDRAFPFKNVCGLLKFTVAEDITAVKIHGANDEAVAGDVRVTFSEGLPVVTLVNALDEISLAIPGAGTYYVCTYPLASLAGFDITVTTEKGNEVIHSAKTLSMARGKMINMGDLDDQRFQVDYFITPDGAGLHNGRTWENAMTWAEAAEILAANRSAESGSGNIASALPSDATYKTNHSTTHFNQINGTKFHFAQGNYITANYLRMDFPDNAEAAVIEFYGGYNPASTGKSLADRDVANYPTVITQSTSHRHFYFRENVDLTFDGITFSDGKGDSTYGGGHAMVRGVKASTTTSISYNNCSFTDNIASPSGTPAGGGVFNANGYLTLTFTDCDFTGNSSITAGGVLYVDGSGVNITFNGNATDSTRFTGNSAGTEGGAIYMDATANTGSFEGTLTIGDKVAFRSNSAVTYGGAISYHSGNLIVGAATFKGNSLTNADGSCSGGAVELIPRTSSVAGVANVEARFTGTSFIGNTINPDGTTSGARGGAVGLGAQLGNYYFNGCLFQENACTGSKSYGGAIGYGNDARSILYLNDCAFYKNNSATHGLDIWMQGAYVGVNNCSFGNTTSKQTIVMNKNTSNPTGLIVTNSTFLLPTTNICPSSGNTNAGLYLMNNVMFTAGSTCISAYNSTPIIFGGFNYGGGATQTAEDRFWTWSSPSAESDYTYYNASWTNTVKNKDTGYSAARAAYTLDDSGLYYKCASNPLATGCDADKMEEFMKAAKFTTVTGDYSYNQDFGPRFYAWLVSIGAWGKDIEGNSRGANWWPGCYEKN